MSSTPVWLHRVCDELVVHQQHWVDPVVFKSVESILQPDPRFADLYVIENGVARGMTLADHHRALANVCLTGKAPAEVATAFDRARNTIIYAFFDYDLFVVGEVQAFGAFELALKHRLNGDGGAARGTLRNLVDRARRGKLASYRRLCQVPRRSPTLSKRLSLCEMDCLMARPTSTRPERRSMS